MTPPAANLITRLGWSAFTAWHLRYESSLPYWPLDRVRALQGARVKKVISFAWREVPFYRDAMLRSGLHPKDFRNAEDLALLPLVDKTEMIANPERFRPVNRSLSSLRLQSSGTTGRARYFDYDTAAVFHSLAHGYRQRVVLSSILGKSSGYREAAIMRVDGVAWQIRQFYETHSWQPARLDLQRILISPGESYPRILDRLEDFQPDVVWAYGSYLGSFYRWAARQAILSHLPRVVVYGGDRMADADRAFIEDELHVPVFSFYQAVESLRIAFQCELSQGLHVNLDQVAVRVIDDSGRTLGPGETGEIVISNLINRATVLLNYRIGDRVTIGRGACPCGRSLPTLERIEGRADDLVLLPDGSSIHSLAILEGLQAVPGVVQVQLTQEELRHFVLRVVCSDAADWTFVESRLSAAFHASIDEHATLQIERVPAIPPGASGKVRAVISRCHENR